MAEVKFADLKKAVKEINALKIEDVENIRTVGIKREKMEDLFLAAVDKISDAGMEESLSDFIIEVNNSILDVREGVDPEPEPEPEKKPAGKKPAGKKPAGKKPADKKPADKKPADKKPAAKAPRSCYDHIVGKQTGNLDEALREGGTMESIMKSCGVGRTRVLAHIKYLKDTCGLTLIYKADKKDDKMKDSYKFKEKEYRKP